MQLQIRAYIDSDNLYHNLASRVAGFYVTDGVGGFGSGKVLSMTGRSLLDSIRFLMSVSRSGLGLDATILNFLLPSEWNGRGT